MKQNIIAFDIETAPLPLDQLEVPQFTARSNTKDPQKIDAQIDAKREKWKENLALSPETGKILAWGYLTSDGGGGCEIESGHDEKKLLEDFFNDFEQRMEYWWVGHNIFGLDIPFIIKRAWRHGIELPPAFMSVGSFGVQRSCFIDTMWWWAKPEKPTGGGLNRIAKFLGVGEKNGDGKFFSEMYAEDPEKAHAYLANDLRLTMGVARKMQVFGESPNVRGD